MSSKAETPPEMLDPRVPLAAERTLLAWIRTGVTLMGFGFVVARFGLLMQELAATRGETVEPERGLSVWFGLALVLLGIFVNLLAAWEYRRTVARLYRGQPLELKRFPLAVILSGLLAIIGLGLAAYLLGIG